MLSQTGGEIVKRPHMQHTPALGRVQDSILFVPGLWNTAEVWKPWADYFALRGCQSWAINLHNGQENVSTLDCVDKVANALDYIKQEFDATPILVGHSAGGLIARIIANNNPEVPAIVLVASVGPVGISNISWPLILNLWRYLPELYIRSVNKSIRRAMAEMSLVIDASEPLSKRITRRFEDLVSTWEELILKEPPKVGRMIREIILSKIQVDKLDCPVLIIACQKDKVIPIRIQRALAAQYNCTGRDYIECSHGHMSILTEKSGSIPREVLAWLHSRLG